MSRLLREPLLHFLALAGFAFAANHYWVEEEKERIVVARQTVEHLVRQAADLQLRELSPAERDEVVAAFVEDEILYREAYRRGLDRSDSRMRQNLVRKMRGLLAGELGTPDEATLRAFYEANLERYTSPERLRLDHVYFSDPGAVPAGLRDRLRSGADPAGEGERFRPGAVSLRAVSMRDVVGMLGPSVARALVDLVDGEWAGPLESRMGVHFVRIVERTPPVVASYEDVARYVEGDWALAETRRLIEAEVERLAEGYEIVIETEPPGR